VKLPTGAIGFCRGERAGSSDSRAFLAACHDAARRTGGTVTAIQKAAVTPNFDAVRLAYEHERGFQVTSAAELRQPVTASDLSELAAVEHEQIRYWKPATAGEILFNYWD
jgi:hypothetical protein